MSRVNGSPDSARSTSSSLPNDMNLPTTWIASIFCSPRWSLWNKNAFKYVCIPIQAASPIMRLWSSTISLLQSAACSTSSPNSMNQCSRRMSMRFGQYWRMFGSRANSANAVCVWYAIGVGIRMCTLRSPKKRKVCWAGWIGCESSF